MSDDGPENPQFREIIEQLRGTCKSLHDVEGAEELENDPAFCTFLDGELLLCETCGWWADTYEVDDDGNCEQCQEGEED